MPGPQPKDPSARRRRNTPATVTMLPVAGRKGRAAPDWPLPPDPNLTAALQAALAQIETLREKVDGTSDGRSRGRYQRQLNTAERVAKEAEVRLALAERAELEFWADLWAMPQAVVWEKSRSERSVAAYCRWQIKADLGDEAAARLAIRYGTELGMTPKALLALRLQIEQTDEAEDKGRRRRAGVQPARRAKAGGDDDPRQMFA